VCVCLCVCQSKLIFYARCEGQSSLRKLNSPNLNAIRFKDDTAVAEEMRLFRLDQAT